MSRFSNEKMSWYSFNKLRTCSACSWGHTSRPNKSNFSRSKSCLCFSESGLLLSLLSREEVGYFWDLIGGDHTCDRHTFLDLSPIPGIISQHHRDSVASISQGSIDRLHIYSQRERRRPLLQTMGHYVHLITMQNEIDLAMNGLVAKGRDRTFTSPLLPPHRHGGTRSVCWLCHSPPLGLACPVRLSSTRRLVRRPRALPTWRSHFP